MHGCQTASHLLRARARTRSPAFGTSLVTSGSPFWTMRPTRGRQFTRARLSGSRLCSWRAPSSLLFATPASLRAPAAAAAQGGCSSPSTPPPRPSASAWPVWTTSRNSLRTRRRTGLLASSRPVRPDRRPVYYLYVKLCCKVEGVRFCAHGLQVPLRAAGTFLGAARTVRSRPARLPRHTTSQSQSHSSTASPAARPSGVRPAVSALRSHTLL
mmetsp:Transcript_321/g.1071  ORF Transcript_321/g.1071 Transcript_321/m.1071 type:complete len:213 (+) Transcript_321:3715-4353(+)